nr:uncharacterized protein LOC105870908 [Microcebus murinus]XP_020138607.1 uncharacterized protein LOC105870908 [Microcebus murinus]
MAARLAVGGSTPTAHPARGRGPPRPLVLRTPHQARAREPGLQNLERWTPPRGDGGGSGMLSARTMLGPLHVGKPYLQLHRIFKMQKGGGICRLTSVWGNAATSGSSFNPPSSRLFSVLRMLCCRGPCETGSTVPGRRWSRNPLALLLLLQWLPRDGNSVQPHWTLLPPHTSPPSQPRSYRWLQLGPGGWCGHRRFTSVHQEGLEAITPHSNEHTTLSALGF